MLDPKVAKTEGFEILVGRFGLPTAKEPTAGRKRRFHPKTRTGCKACKRKRVKCDETKPSCLRCFHLNSICEYDPLKIWVFEPEHRNQPKAALSKSNATPEVSRAIQFFHEVTIPLLGRYNSAAELFFARIIPQIGALLGKPHLSERCRSRRSEALWRSTQNSRGPLTNSSPEIILASCLLSIAMENFRYDTKASFLHLQSGLQVLREWKEAHREDIWRKSDMHEIIERKIEPIFAQLEATASMTGEAGSTEGGENLHWKRPQMPESFRDLARAREKFFEMGYWLYIQHKHNPLFGRDSPQFADFDELWHEWSQKFQAFTNTIPKSAELEQIEALLLSVHERLHYLAFVCQSTPETELVWDQYIEVFRWIMKCCADLNERDDVYDTKANRLSTSFCRDPGILPPCWQTAVDCRDPVIRRQALQLLHSHHRRCGETDDCSAAAIAQVIIDLEEEGLVVNSCSDIPESRRVRPLAGDLTQPGKLIVTYTRYPYVEPETIEVPLHQDSPPRVLPFKLFPMGETVRLAGYQGLVRPRTYACRCKSYGIK